MEIRDWLHGAIQIDGHEVPIVESRFFQRLRHIRQLGFAEAAYPNATHNRFIHSLGALFTATRIFDAIFPGSDPELLRFRSLVRLSALLHDIGHGPLSHTIEDAMPDAGTLGFKSGTQATHEDYTASILKNSSLTPILEKSLQAFHWSVTDILTVLDPDRFPPKDPSAFEVAWRGQKISMLPLISQIVSSELDCDRMDYLRRDSRQTGVRYGEFDFDWLVSNLTWHCHLGRAHLALRQRALYTFEDFLISRAHMFLMVYFHRKSVVYDSMLEQYLKSPDCDYALPSDPEAYLEYDDQHLFLNLRKSSNHWAKRITERRPFQVIIEEHSGVRSNRAQDPKSVSLETVEHRLKQEGIAALKDTSKSVFSKYTRKAPPIFVQVDDYLNTPSWVELQECTDLFERYRESRTVQRLYVAPEDLARAKKLFVSG